MSAELDGIISFIGDLAVGAIAATGALIRGVGIGAARLGVAAYEGAVALTKMSIEAAKAVGSATADAFKEMHELQSIVTEEKRRQREAYDAYVNGLKADEKRRKQHIEKLEGMIAFESLGIEEAAKNKLRALADDEKIKVYNHLINLQSKFTDVGNIFFRLSDYGIESDSEYEFFKIKKQLAQNVNGGNYNFTETFTALDNLFSLLRALQNDVDNQDAVEFIAAQLFQIENEFDSPLLMNFYAELYDMLRMPEEPSESAQDKLFAVEKEVLELVQLFRDFNYEFEEKEEFTNLLRSVKSIVISEDSAETKLKLVEMRYHRMIDIYKKVSARDSEILELKRLYNEAISLNYYLRESLSLPLPRLNFDYRTASAEIKRLSAENEELAKRTEEQNKREYIRKAIRETMKEMQFDYLCSETAATANNTAVSTDIYHIDNGNVVSVTLVNDRVCCSVSGVKLNGIPENKGAVVNSMHTFCSKRKAISQSLQSKGVAVEFDAPLEPDEKYAEEIALTDVSPSVIEKIRREKQGRKATVAVQKKRTFN